MRTAIDWGRRHVPHVLASVPLVTGLALSGYGAFLYFGRGCEGLEQICGNVLASRAAHAAFFLTWGYVMTLGALVLLGVGFLLTRRRA